MGHVFSASGFFATVGNGILAGAGGGGVTSLINGTNFLEGLTKGAVIGGVAGGISWGLSRLFIKYEYSYDDDLVSDDNTLVGGTKAEFSADTVTKIDNARFKNQFIRGSYKLVDESSDLSSSMRGAGYSYNSSTGHLDGPNGAAWGTTEKVTHNGILVRQRIYLPKGTFVSAEQLELTMGHEIFHTILNNARLFDELGGILNRSDSVHEYFISKWEEKYINFRGWQKLNLNMVSPVNSVAGDSSLIPLINKIKPIFKNYLKSTLK